MLASWNSSAVTPSSSTSKSSFVFSNAAHFFASSSRSWLSAALAASRLAFLASSWVHSGMSLEDELVRGSGEPGGWPTWGEIEVARPVAPVVFLRASLGRKKAVTLDAAVSGLAAAIPSTVEPIPRPWRVDEFESRRPMVVAIEPRRRIVSSR